MKLKILAAALALTTAAPAFGATVIYDLTTSDPAAELGNGPYGTVTVQDSGGSLIITESLLSGFRIHDGNANHNALSFSIVGDPAITVSNLTSGFSLVNSSVTAPPFGTFDYAIDCSSACGHGWPGGFAGTLSFTVSAASPLSLSSLAFNSVGGKDIFFTSGLVNSAGKTGNVGGTAPVATPAPEPAAWAMLIAGFAVIGNQLRRRSRPALSAA